MFEVLNKYLLQHKTISIPGLGSLYVETVPAITDFANRRILPLQLKFRFDKYFDAPDREFFNYLSHQQNIADYEAIKLYNEFAYDLRNTIRTQEEAVWEGIGVFKKDARGEVAFESFASPFELYPIVAAERVIRSDARHSLLVGDQEKTNYEMSELLHEETHVEKESWWIYALILGAIGLIIILFHFLASDIQWGITGNQQQIDVSEPPAATVNSAN